MSESYAENHWNRLKKFCPTAQRIQNVSPPYEAWLEAAKKCKSDHFISVDADSWVEETFVYDDVYDWHPEDRRIHVWRCRNAVNGLVYGHGAIKLWPKSLFFEDRQPESVDFTADMARHGFYTHQQIASVNQFNSSAFETFSGAYKECFKMAAGQTNFHKTWPDYRTPNRLRVWASLGRDVEFGEWSILGARMGILEARERKDSNDLQYLKDAYGRDRLQDLFDSIEDGEAKNLALSEPLKQMGIEVEDVTAEQSRKYKKWLQPT